LKQEDRVRINENIRASELRVIAADGGNIGVISLSEALAKAKEAGLDLIEISPLAVPPVARIMDYGKFQYEQKKKAKEIKQRSVVTETKNMQVKIGTGDHDKELKASRVDEWLKEGHRIKIDLFLFGRYKYMDEKFLKERLNQFMTVIKEPYKIAEEMKKSPKGYSLTIERDKGGKRKVVEGQETPENNPSKEPTPNGGQI
jgi:translation initiation factor IF-3